jgi:hypothetical protein
MNEENSHNDYKCVFRIKCLAYELAVGAVTRFNREKRKRVRSTYGGKVERCGGDLRMRSMTSMLQHNLLVDQLGCV